MNEISPTDRLYELVTELLGDGADGLRPGEVRDTIEEAIRDWRDKRGGSQPARELGR